MFIETVAWSAATQAAVLGIALGLAWMGGQLLAGQDFPIAPPGSPSPDWRSSPRWPHGGNPGCPTTSPTG
ncbi:hypothetical protein [Glutamicibacter nicotianae]|uniref:hypothetical protein n=1 Tax=Glutamicibacter nicotianae TaxID=37929 RepID=UPI00167F70A5|nr:hypothetical protein [Glutamicibacter nicotianae]